MTEAHPSHFELDRFALGVGQADTHAHVATCERCRAHLATVAPDDAPMPLALKSPVARSRRRGFAFALASSTVAAAAVAFVVVRPPIRPRTPPIVETTAARGTPAIGIYVRRGEQVRLWDGSSSIAPGDALRVSIVGDGYRYVAVFGADASGSLTRLYEGPVDPRDETVLPPAWLVDDRGSSETLVVVLDDTPIEASPRAPIESATTHGRWVRRLVLPKRGSDGGTR